MAEENALDDCYAPSVSGEGSIIIVSLGFGFVALVNFSV